MMCDADVYWSFIIGLKFYHCCLLLVNFFHTRAFFFVWVRHSLSSYLTIFCCGDICLHCSKLLVVDIFDFRWSNSNLILTSSCMVFGGWSFLLFSGHKIALCGLFSGSLDVKTWGLRESWSGHGWTRSIGAWWISRWNKLMQLSLHCNFGYACEVVPISLWSIFWEVITFSLSRSNYPLCTGHCIEMISDIIHFFGFHHI
jgi:hypothetical protein